MDPTHPWTTISGEGTQPEPYPLDVPFGEAIQPWDFHYPCSILEPGSIYGMPGIPFYQTASSHEKNGDWSSNSASEGQQYSHQESLDTQAGPLTFESSPCQALPQILVSQPGLDPSEQFLAFGSIYSLPFHCFWPSCKARTRSFLLSTDLAHHVTTYHLHRCPWPTCSMGKPFRRRSDLNRHLASVHIGSRKHRCDVPGCEKAYTRSDKLTAHKRIHGGSMDPTATSIINSGSLHAAARAPVYALDTLASRPSVVHVASSTLHCVCSPDSACSGDIPPALDFWFPLATPQGGPDALPPSAQDYQSSLPLCPPVNHTAQQAGDLPFSPDSLVTQEQDSVLTQSNNNLHYPGVLPRK